PRVPPNVALEGWEVKTSCAGLQMKTELLSLLKPAATALMAPVPPFPVTDKSVQVATPLESFLVKSLPDAVSVPQVAVLLFVKLIDVELSLEHRFPPASWTNTVTVPSEAPSRASEGCALNTNCAGV